MYKDPDGKTAFDDCNHQSSTRFVSSQHSYGNLDVLSTSEISEKIVQLQKHLLEVSLVKNEFIIAW